MAFCSSCGTKLADEARFCPSCGLPTNQDDRIQSQVQQTLAQQEAMRTQILEELQRTYDYFISKKATYDELDEVNAKIDYYSRYRRPGFIVWGVIFSVVSFMFLELTGLFVGESDSFNAVIGISLFFLLASVGLGVMFFVLFGRTKANARKQEESLTRRTVNLCTELDEYYQEFGYCVVGEEFTNPKILSAIAGVVQSGRADSVKEAINVLLDDNHKTQMELSAAMTAAAARQAAHGATTAAVFSAANFFLR